MIPLTYDRLNEAQVAQMLVTTPGWSVDQGALVRSWSFSRYVDGVLFAVSVARASENLNHHPCITLDYGQVTVSMVTHDAGGGLTAYDFELARRVNALG